MNLFKKINLSRPFKLALVAFISLRLWISLLGLLGVLFMPIAAQTDYPASPVMVQQLDANVFSHLFLSPWYRFDTTHYLEIAQFGYGGKDYESAFAPLYPLLIHLLNYLIPSPMLAAILISNLAALITFWLLLILLQQLFNEYKARQGLLWLVVFPASFILLMGYTESLFFALFLACILSLDRQQWITAALLAGLATLTRFQGLALIILFAAKAWQIWQENKNHNKFPLKQLLAPLIAAIFPMLVFMTHLIILHWVYQVPWPWQMLSSSWNQHIGWPWEGIFGNVWAIFSYNLTLFHISLVFDLIAALLVPIFLIKTRKQIPFSLQIICWLFYLSAIMKITDHGILTSVLRYVLPVFPMYTGMGQLFKQPRLKMLMVTISICLQALCTLMFYKWIWVF